MFHPGEGGQTEESSEGESWETQAEQADTQPEEAAPGDKPEKLFVFACRLNISYVKKINSLLGINRNIFFHKCSVQFVTAPPQPDTDISVQDGGGLLPGQPRAAAQPDLICLNLFKLFNLSFRKRSLKIKIC